MLPIVCRVFELRKPFLFMAYQCLLLPDVYVGLGSEPHIRVNFRADLNTLWDIAAVILLVCQSSLFFSGILCVSQSTPKVKDIREDFLL